jgi:hypothetical protein
VVIRPVDGTASSVDTTAHTLTLTLTNSTNTQAVQWNSSTTFVGVTAATLANTAERVEGYLSGSTLIARTVSATSNMHTLMTMRLELYPIQSMQRVVLGLVIEVTIDTNWELFMFTVYKNKLPH